MSIHFPTPFQQFTHLLSSAALPCSALETLHCLMSWSMFTSLILGKIWDMGIFQTILVLFKWKCLGNRKQKQQDWELLLSWSKFRIFQLLFWLVVYRTGLGEQCLTHHSQDSPTKRKPCAIKTKYCLRTSIEEQPSLSLHHSFDTYLYIYKIGYVYIIVGYYIEYTCLFCALVSFEKSQCFLSAALWEFHHGWPPSPNAPLWYPSQSHVALLQRH